MKEIPILFKDDMVRAILEGRKTQSRRVIKPQPILMDSGTWYPSEHPGDKKNKTGLHYANEKHMRKGLAIDFCPYGQPGDILWVKEYFSWVTLVEKDPWDSLFSAIKRVPANSPHDHAGCKVGMLYRATDTDWEGEAPWKSSLFMPRWASRINLEVVSVRAERVQEINEEDVKAEGIGSFAGNIGSHSNPTDFYVAFPEKEGGFLFASEAFEALWNFINAKRGYGWDVNPWVWRIEFKAAA